jgi:hypothetical protein
MCEIHIEQEAKLTGLPYDILAKRLSRERNARMEAERLLEQKSLELYNANQDLAASLAKFDKERTLLSAVFNARLRPGSDRRYAPDCQTEHRCSDFA